MRIPHAPFMEQIDNSTALIRELHVYGPEAEIGSKGKIQHKGLGSKLLEEAEEIGLLLLLETVHKVEKYALEVIRKLGGIIVDPSGKKKTFSL